MPTFEVDDQLHSHPKPARAGLEAMGLWVMAGSWCACYLTDGRVPRDSAHRLGDVSLWDRLVQAQLVEPTDEGYQLHDYLHWNRPASEIHAARLAAANKKRDQRAKKRAQSKCDRAVSPYVSPGDSPRDVPRDGPRYVPRDVPPCVPRESPVSPAPAPAQTHTQMEKPPVVPREKKPKTVEVILPQDWKPSESHYEQARKELGKGKDWVDRQADIMRDWALAKGARGLNWDARFRNWMRKALDMGPLGRTSHQPSTGQTWTHTQVGPEIFDVKEF